MRLLKRNTKEFEYLPNTGETSDINADGDHTGEYRPVYGEPVTYRGNISVPSGHTQHQFFGEDIRYTHILVMDNPDVAIDEFGVIRFNGDLYDITAVRPSLNAVSIVIRKQTKTYPEPDPEPDDPDDEPPETDGDGE
jgi:hypothetical protein